MTKQLWLYFKICAIALKRLFKEKYTYRASALAFTTLLAIVPLLAVIVSSITIFPIFTKLVNLAREYIVANFIPTSSNIVEYYLENFVSQAARLPTIAIFFLLFTAIMLILTVEHTLNEIWHAPQRKKKWTAWFLYWLVLILTPLFIGLSVFLTSYVFSLSWFAGATSKLGLQVPLLASLPLLINTIIFSMLYTVVPNSKVHWHDSLMGGFIAAILFELAKIGFAFYIKQFPSYELIYGALATVPIFLLWLYISWLITLYGAIVTHTKYLQSRK